MSIDNHIPESEHECDIAASVLQTIVAELEVIGCRMAVLEGQLKADDVTLLRRFVAMGHHQAVHLLQSETRNKALRGQPEEVALLHALADR